MAQYCGSDGYDAFGIPCVPTSAPTAVDHSFFASVWHIVLVVVLALIVLAILSRAFRIIQAYQNGVVFRLGKAVAVREPGLVMVIPFIDRLERVNMWQETLGLSSQSVVSKDNVSLSIQAVIYFKVTDAIKALVDVDDYRRAVKQRAEAVLRQVIGGQNLDQILAHGATVTSAIKDALSVPASAWGLEVEDIQLKDLSLPKRLTRAMGAQAEASREAAAKVIAAQGEHDSAAKLKDAAELLGEGGFALRRLQTLREIATDRSPIIVMDSSNGGIAAQVAAGNLAADN